MGASQTFTASIHFDRPSGAAFSPKPEPQETGSNSTDKNEANERGGAERGFRHDQSGTLTIKRSSQDAIQVTSGGALDSFNASYPVNPTAAAPGSKPNPFVQAVYNALALAPNTPNHCAPVMSGTHPFRSGPATTQTAPCRSKSKSSP